MDFEATGFPNGAKSRQPASTLFLTVMGSDKQNILTWADDTPWENFEFDIYRSLDGETYNLLATTFDRSYIDGNLINGNEYCYFVEAFGTYGFDGIVEPLVNKSQRACQVPFDAVPPCVPELVVDNACDEENAASTTVFENTLTWRIVASRCANPEDVSGYRIYYAPNLESEFTLLDESNDPDLQTYTHGSEFGIAGCYTVTALDSLGNESDSSNIGCVENCPFYSLPNVFTPNAGRSK